MTLTAGEIALAGGQIGAEAGRVALVASGGMGTVNVATGEPSGGEPGRIALTGGALVDTSGAGGGRIALRGREVRLTEAAAIRSDNRGDVPADGEIAITCRGSVRR